MATRPFLNRVLQFGSGLTPNQALWILRGGVDTGQRELMGFPEMP